LNAFVLVNHNNAVFVPVDGLHLAYVYAFSALVAYVNVIPAIILFGNPDCGLFQVGVFEKNLRARFLTSPSADTQLRFCSYYFHFPFAPFQ